MDPVTEQTIEETAVSQETIDALVNGAATGPIAEPDPAGEQLEGPLVGEHSDADLARLHAVPVELAVEIGRTRMTIGDTLGLGPGSIITLNRMAGEPVDLLVNGRPIARGEVVVIDEEFGLRVTEVVGSAVPGGGSAA